LLAFSSKQEYLQQFFLFCVFGSIAIQSKESNSRLKKMLDAILQKNEPEEGTRRETGSTFTADELDPYDPQF
jgi:hypothetical protein